MGKWIETTVGDFCPFEYGTGLKEADRRSGPVPVYGSNGIVGYHDNAYVKTRGVIIGRKGTVGAVHYSSTPFFPIDTTFYVTEIENKDIRFIYYLLKSLGLEHMNSDSAVPGLNRTAAHSRIISVPESLIEQQSIAGILGALDDKIELNRRVNQTLESMARTLFRQWFVENGDIENWKIGRVGDFIEVNERSIAKDYPYEEIEYIDISSVVVGYLEGTTTYSLKDSPSRAKRLVQHGDTIWSTVRPNRKSYLFISTPKENLVVSTGFAVLTPKKIPPSFLYFLTTTEQFVDYLVSNADGSAYPAVLPERFADAEFSIPPKDVLEKFESIISPMLAKIARNEKESHTLTNLRNTLLPKLLSGEVSVK